MKMLVIGGLKILTLIDIVARSCLGERAEISVLIATLVAPDAISRKDRDL